MIKHLEIPVMSPYFIPGNGVFIHTIDLPKLPPYTKLM
jgi:hypothetical protein